MSENLEHHYRAESEQKALIPGCLAMLFFLLIGLGFFVGLAYLVKWVS
ncbi:MAG: hypothetical protein AAFY41_09395 [Bacteroidota bacterium]